MVKVIGKTSEAQRISALIKALIHFVDGDKGGVGKSIVCLALVQYFLDNDLSFILLEADRYNPDIRRKYEGIIEEVGHAVFSDDADRTEADDIIEYAKEKQVIISLPSQVSKPLGTWLEDGIETAEENGVKFIRWFVVSGTYESLNLLRLALEKHASKMQFIVVKNYGLNDDWSAFETELNPEEKYDSLPKWKPMKDDDERLKEVKDEEKEEVKQNDLIARREMEQKQIVYLMKKYNVQTIDFPKLPTAERYLLDAYNLTFKNALTSKALESRSTSKTRIRKFLQAAYDQFDSVMIN